MSVLSVMLTQQSKIRGIAYYRWKRSIRLYVDQLTPEQFAAELKDVQDEATLRHLLAIGVTKPFFQIFSEEIARRREK